jgi:formate dehydrogenase major subunit
MKLTRRTFLKISGATAVGIAASRLGLDLSPVEAYAAKLRKDLKAAKEVTSICPYCAVGCGVIVHSIGGKVINIEGDPDHVINEGTLCSKGASLYQLSAANPNRLAQPMYRAPYATEWKTVTWEWALREIARRVRMSRDAGFMAKNAKGQVVNRTNGIAHVGSAALDNEECFMLQKLMRSWGLVYIEHQARI